jgi:hypothetical protein
MPHLRGWFTPTAPVTRCAGRLSEIVPLRRDRLTRPAGPALRARSALSPTGNVVQDVPAPLACDEGSSLRRLRNGWLAIALDDR